MSVIEKLDALEGVRVDVEEGADGLWRIAGSRSDIIKLGEVLRELPAIRQDMIDARRYREVRAICCSAEGPSDELASAWMTGDEAAMDLAADLARATGEGEGHE